MKDEFKGIPINKFIGLKSKMYCIVSENDTVKGVNISIEFKEHENVLFNKKLIRSKKLQGVKVIYTKLVHMMSVKYLYHDFMTKDIF